MSGVYINRGDPLSLDVIDESFKAIGLAGSLSSAGCVALKPNLTLPVPSDGVTTRVEFIRSVIDLIVDYNPRIRIYIVESDGGYKSFSMNSAFENHGYKEIEKSVRNVRCLNLSREQSVAFPVNTSKGSLELRLPEVLIKEVDFSISCPVPKVHCMTRMTASLKNLWGCIPDPLRLQHHYIFSELIIQLPEILGFRYALLDGLYGLDKNGPIDGEVVRLDWYGAANSLFAMDCVLAEMMGFRIEDVPYLALARKKGLLPSEGEIVVSGKADRMARQFTLKRNLWNYAALAAFRSRGLTELVYLSRWSKIIHDLMYTVRKRSIDQEYRSE